MRTQMSQPGTSPLFGPAVDVEVLWMAFASTLGLEADIVACDGEPFLVLDEADGESSGLTRVSGFEPASSDDAFPADLPLAA